MKEVKDSREYDEDEQRRNSLKSSHLQNGKIEWNKNINFYEKNLKSCLKNNFMMVPNSW